MSLKCVCCVGKTIWATFLEFFPKIPSPILGMNKRKKRSFLSAFLARSLRSRNITEKGKCRSRIKNIVL